MSKRKGGVVERELLEFFHSIGFSGVRVAGSGSSRFPCSDLLVGKSGVLFAVEVKFTSKGFVYVSKQQLDSLLVFSRNIGAFPLVAVKFGGFGWRFFIVSNNFASKTVRFDLSMNGFNKDNFLIVVQKMFKSVLD